MAAIRSRAESFTLDLPNAPMDVVPSAVLSPITELSMNLEHNSISMAKTPKRKLSLCNIGTPNTPNTWNPSPLFQRTLSNESGYCPSSPVGPGFDSPTLEVLKSSNNSGERRKPFHLSKPLFKRWNSSPAGTGDDDYTYNKENIPSPLGLPDDMKTDEFVFARPRVPSFVRRFSVPARSSGGRPLPQRSLSDPLSENSTDWQPSVLSPSKLSDSQDSACDVDFDDEHGDDDFIDEMVRAHHDKDDNIDMPSGMAGLLSAPLVSKKSPEQSVKNEQKETPKQPSSEVRPKRDLFNSSEKTERRRSNTHTTNDEEKHFTRPRSKSFALKRPNPPRDNNPMEKKRLRQRCMSLVENSTLMPSPLLSSRVSFKHKSPLKRSNSEVFENRPDFSFLGHGTKKLVGDFSRPYTLPFIEKGVQHQDLISITPETVVRVINGEFNDQIEAHIIDCRYPFEYKGGHIKGAINVYRKEDFYEEYLKKPKHAGNKQLVLIFHCEFSSKRGPDMSRFLRNRDRDMNGKDYPSLYYPELYLLEGGYKNFFFSQKEYCEPQEYVLMIDEKHSEDLKLFSKRSKSWSEGHGKKAFRPGLNYR